MSAYDNTYEIVVTSGRSGEKLAQRCGFEDLSAFAGSLMTNAQVLDVGAGASPFGKQVAKLRPDITWTNFDLHYDDPDLLNLISQDAPPNVKYAAGSVTDKLLCEAESMDMVFSYWMFPHLSLDNRAPAFQAARNVFNVLRPGGVSYIGPQMAKSRFRRAEERKSTLNLVKDGVISEEAFASYIVNATCPSLLRRAYLRNRYEITYDFFGTTAWKKDGGKQVYSPESKAFIPALSREGLQILGKLGVASVQYLFHKASPRPDRKSRNTQA